MKKSGNLDTLKFSSYDKFEWWQQSSMSVSHSILSSITGKSWVYPTEMFIKE